MRSLKTLILVAAAMAALPAQADAACGRSEVLARNMDEDGAAAAGDPWPVVVIDLDDQIVEVVVSLQPVARLARAATDRAVVAAIGRVLAPGIARSDGADWQRGPGPGDSVGPPPQPLQPELSPRRSPISFPLVGKNAPPAQRDGD